jgi:TRAP-type C4-dicarboxylate transport system permease small subunit
MKKVKIISTILFYPVRILAIVYLIVTLYSAISVFTEWSYITRENGNNFSVCYPFTDTPFLNGHNSWGYKLFNFLIPIGFIGIFFLILSNIFNVFRQPEIVYIVRSKTVKMVLPY